MKTIKATTLQDVLKFLKKNWDDDFDCDTLPVFANKNYGKADGVLSWDKENKIIGESTSDFEIVKIAKSEHTKKFLKSFKVEEEEEPAIIDEGVDDEDDDE